MLFLLSQCIPQSIKKREKESKIKKQANKNVQQTSVLTLLN